MTDGSNLQKAQLQTLSHVQAASFRLHGWATSAPLKPCAKSHTQRRRSNAVAPLPGDTRGRQPRHASRRALASYQSRVWGATFRFLLWASSLGRKVERKAFVSLLSLSAPGTGPR